MPANLPAEPLGARNPRLGALRRLVERRAERTLASRFVVDGPVLTAEALQSPLAVEVIYVGADVLDGSGGRADGDVAIMRDLAAAQGVTVVPVTAGVLERLADPVTPRPVLAVVHSPATGLDELPEPDGDGDFMLVAVGLADPGNLGTLVRTAEASGARGVAVLGDATDPFSPKAVRASAGSVFRMPITVERDLPLALDALSHRWTLVAAVTDGTPFDDDAALVRHAAVLLGSEAHGLDTRARQAASHSVSIPMAGDVESLNVGVAGAVLAFDLARRRRMGSGR
jgi:RNA methyltransferase, TrmH family